MTYTIDQGDAGKPDLETVSKEMLVIFKESLGADWGKIRPDMEKQVMEVRASIDYINELQIAGELTEESAREMIEFQELNIKMLMIEFGGMKDIAIETAINAAFKKVREAVNRLVNFELL